MGSETPHVALDSQHLQSGRTEGSHCLSSPSSPA